MKITEAAAKQIVHSAKQSDALKMGLRIAARRMPDGGIDYAMGFDDKQDADSTYNKFGAQILIAPTSADLLARATLDYVTLDSGEREFVFLNPLDPNYSPPKQQD